MTRKDMTVYTANQSLNRQEVPKSPGIYFLSFVNHPAWYIGSTSELPRRLNNHRRLLERNKHCNKYLQRVFDKYGRSESLLFTVVEVFETCEYLRETEQQYLDCADWENICNILKDVEHPGMGVPRPPEVIAKMLLSRGEYRASELTRQRLRESHLAYWSQVTEEEKKERYSYDRKGFKQSEEHVRKLALTRMTPITQYDLQGNKLNEYESITAAVKAEKVSTASIQKCLTGEREYVGLYTWKRNA